MLVHMKRQKMKNKLSKKQITDLSLTAWGVIFLILGFIFEKTSNTYKDFDWSNFTSPSFYSSFLFLSFLFYTIGYIPLLVKTIKSCVKEIKEKEIFNEYLLMSIATLGAYIISEYPECLFVLIFSLIGSLLEEYATDKSKKSISKLVNSMPLYAHLLQDDGSYKDVEPKDLKVGDIIQIKPGEKICVDSIVVSGSTSLNMASLSGESLPKDVKVNDKVLSGSININSLINVKVEKVYADSTLSKMLKLIEDEQGKKAKSEKFITKFASFYTPAVMLIALLVFLFGFGLNNWLFNPYGRDYLYKALSILLISCPCAMVISVPLTFFAGIGVGSKFGILIKGSASIEALARCDTACFDKTGTLTKGCFKLINDVDKSDLQIAASLESKSTHPIGKVLVDENKEQLLDVIDFENIDGKGIKGTINDDTYFIGSKKLLTSNNIDVDVIQTPYKVIYLGSVKKGFITSFIIADVIKENASTAITNLKNEGVKNTYIFSGDEKQIAEKVKQQCNIDYVKAELLPEEKATEIKKLKDEKKKICYVGDGTNDSLSMLSSDVSISMGGLGSDSAIEASDVVIADDNLLKIAEAKRLAKQTLLTVFICLGIALLIKILFMILVLLNVFGRFSMMISSLCDTGAMVICVLYALTLLKYKSKYLTTSK